LPGERVAFITMAVAKFEDSKVAKAMKADQARFEIFTEAYKTQREWVARRFTADSWLDENHREWDALDRLCRTRPWATNRDKAYEYPFRTATETMRKVEGPWIGDEKGKVANTRGEAGSEVITQLITPQTYPPVWRVIIFTPEYGSEMSLDLENWNYLEPENEVDVWLVCWQGWTRFDEMIEQVTNHCLSFGDGSSTIWFGQGMGGLVAYEVAKAMEKFESSNFPYGLIVSDCPAPHLFASSYLPYEMDGWEDMLKGPRMTERQRKIVDQEVAMMTKYTMKHGDNKKVYMPIKAFYHEEDKMGVTEDNVKAWEEYAEDFELMDMLDEEEELDLYTTGKGYAFNVDPAIVSTISEIGSQYPRYDRVEERPDLGDTDGPIPEEVDVLVVGAGVTGLYQAAQFKDDGRSVLMVDRVDGIGGVWYMHGNDYSRVNSSEVAYRYIDKKGTWQRTNEDHTPKADMMRDFYEMAATNKDNIRLNIQVDKVSETENGKYEVLMKNVKTGTSHKLIANFVSLHTNRRLGKARTVNFEDSDKFKGKICYGYGNEVRGVNFWKKNVLIVGAGAFAFENVRTSIERGSQMCTLLGRRDGSTCPKWVDMIAFLRPLDDNLHTNKAAAAFSFEVWSEAYSKANLPAPSCWKEGLLKPNGHTISVSDLAFIGGFHGLFGLKSGEVAKIGADGASVELKGDGGKIEKLQLIIKCTGFHLNDECEEMVGESKMYPNGLVKFNINYTAEALFDAGQFGSAKGGHDLDIEYGFTEDEYKAGMEVYKEKGYNEKAIALTGNPFGSGYGGFVRYTSKYMSWLDQHPEEQKAMLEVFGKPQLPLTEFWQSQQSMLLFVASAKAVSALAEWK